MKVCYFGIYRADYSRNRNIIAGLKSHGIEVIEISDRLGGLGKFWRLWQKHRQLKADYGAMIVGFPGQIVMPLAALISRAPVIFDAHLSLYDSVVNDRKQYKPGSVRGSWYFFLDWWSGRLADIILLDTKAHVEYFCETFGLPAKKFRVIYNGTDPGLFTKSGDKNPILKDFIIEFHGYVTPLHGVEYILQAMRELVDLPIKLRIIGAGRLFEYYRSQAAADPKLSSVTFLAPLSPAELAREVAKASLGLGIFGQSGKVDRVIPNKVYELLAMKKAVITADSPAIREKFVHGQDIYLCKKADARSLADAMRKLYQDSKLRENLEQQGGERILQEFTPEKTVEPLVAVLKNVNNL